MAERQKVTAAHRRGLILERLRDGTGNVHVEDLSRLFNVSVATARRDLDRLVREGLATRTYGGAVLGNVHAERTLRERESSNATAKDAIARDAVSLVEPGTTVLLDAGTTTGRLSRYLARIPRLTVLTNGLNALNVLVDSDEDVDVLALGGSLRRTNQGMIGPIAETVVRGIYADVAFLGTDCLDVDKGFSSRTVEQSSLKQLMSTHARRTVVVADSSKLNTTWSTYWTRLPSPCDVITDDGAGEEALVPFREAENVHLTVSELAPTEWGKGFTN